MREAIELTYRMGVLGRHRYVLTDTAVEVTYKTPAREWEASIALEDINPNAIHQKTRRTSFLWIAAVLSIVGALSLALASDPVVVRDDSMSLRIFAGILLVAASGFVVAFSIRGTDVLLFLGSDRSVVLVFPYLKPDPDTFNPFVEDLRSRIVQRKNELAGGPLAPEVSELNLLLRSHRISTDQVRHMVDEALRGEPPKA